MTESSWERHDLHHPRKEWAWNNRGSTKRWPSKNLITLADSVSRWEKVLMWHIPWHIAWFLFCDKSSELALCIFTKRINCPYSSWPIALLLSHHILSEISQLIRMTSSLIRLGLVIKSQPLFPHKCYYVVNSIRAGKAHNWYFTHSCISPRQKLINAIMYFCKCKTVSGPESSLRMSWGENGTWYFLLGL